MASKIERGIQSLLVPSRTGGVSAPTTTTPAINDRDAYMPPPRRGILWPTNELMADLVKRAQAALARGIIWDRGSIVNILL